MQMQFFGAAGMVTGSSFLLSDENAHGILVDMGMFQGDSETEALNYQPLAFDAGDVHSVMLTHAHLDHCGRLPVLLKQGFRGKLYMTQATKEIAEVVLLDAAKIMQHEEDRPVLYTEEDVYDLLKTTEVVSYGEEVDLGGTQVVFRDAGHILGSASIEIKDRNGVTYAFSGDLGNSPEDLVRPTECIDKANIVVMESTYGDRDHPVEDPGEILQSEVNTVEENGGALLIPSFSVERTQVLLHKFAHFKRDGKIKKDTAFYLDSPMGERVTEIYKRFPSLYNDEVAGDTKAGDPFSFENLTIVNSRRASDEIKKNNGPKVIIAGSGMMTGGRILEHARHFLPIPTTRLLIVGFQAENTVGREIEEGAKTVQIYDETVPVKANVRVVHSMSAHADQTKLLEWFKNIKGVSKVFLVHGEDSPRGILAKKLNEFSGASVSLPKIGDSFGV